MPTPASSEARPDVDLAPRRGPASWSVVVYTAVGLITAGFIFIAIAWGRTAGEAYVDLQLPYLISAGLPGLGLIIVGVTVVIVGVKRKNAVKLEEQLTRLAGALAELGQALSEREASHVPRQ